MRIFYIKKKTEKRVMSLPFNINQQQQQAPAKTE